HFEGPRIDSANVAGDADGRARGPGHGMRRHLHALDRFKHPSHFALGRMTVHHDKHGSSCLKSSKKTLPPYHAAGIAAKPTELPGRAGRVNAPVLSGRSLRFGFITGALTRPTRLR